MVSTNDRYVDTANYMKHLGTLIAWLILAAFIVLFSSFIVAAVSAPKLVAAPSLAAVLGIAGVLASKYWESRSRIAEARRIVHLEMYENLLQRFMSMARGGGAASPKRQADLEKFMNDFSLKVLLNGSSDFISKWNAFKKSAGSDSHYGVESFGVLLVQMRNDLGYNDPTVTSGMLLSLIINDLDPTENKPID